MKIQVLKQTQQNWYGSYTVEKTYKGVCKQKFVEVTFHGNINARWPARSETWRTRVCGNDNYAMEIDCSTREEAWNKFIQVIELEYVNREDLIKLGFIIS